MEQLAFADVVVINKTDLVTASEKTELVQRVKVIHSFSQAYAHALIVAFP